MYHVSAQGVDERMINVQYYYYYLCFDPYTEEEEEEEEESKLEFVESARVPH